MEYLKVNGTEYPAHFCGKQIDRDWDGRASKTVTLAMPYAQAVQLFVDGLRWDIVRREAGADDAAQEQDCSGYCVAGPITDNRDGTLSIKMGSYTQLEQALRECGLTGKDFAAFVKTQREDGGADYGLRYEELIALCIRQVQMLRERVRKLEETA